MTDNESTLDKGDALILNAAADAIHAGEPLPEGAAAHVANILRAEAWFIDAMPAVADMWNVALKQVSGGKATVAVAKTQDGGLRIHGDNTSNAINLARLILNNQEN